MSVTTAGQVPGVAGPIVVATDAAEDHRRASAGYLATSGHYGLHAHPYPQRISGAQRTMIAELRAVDYALRHVLPNITPETPVEVRVDNRAALGVLENWACGGTDLPAGYQIWRYSGSTPTLARLQRAVARHAATLTFRHEKAHVGHILNETADSLAKLGLRCLNGHVRKRLVPGLAQHYAAQNLGAYSLTQGRDTG